MLRDSLSNLPGVEVRTFSWRNALLRRYDVLHVHWPEILVAGHSPLKALVRQAFTVALLIKLRLTRTPIVRTVHNLGLPQGISRRERYLLVQIERQTALRIRLNSSTVIERDRAAVTIPHGHYREWFAKYRKTESVPRRIAYFGLIRRYKGVDRLLSAFRSTEAKDVTLRIGGKPSTEKLARHLTELAAGDDRIELTLRFLADAELVDIVSAAELVLLPYREMHNSGGVLTALSLDRPVLVPSNEVTERLAEEVGDGWVWRYDGDLTPELLLDTLERVRSGGRTERPDLSGREWADAGEAHLAAYRRAREIVRGTTARTPGR
ncbi:MAG: beta,4-mannosyltransferase [Microbacteriaceae bacterium]|nr:beta,4-mannosyltransferase [Microbacteriaceae bacterium]